MKKYIDNHLIELEIFEKEYSEYMDSPNFQIVNDQYFSLDNIYNIENI